MNGICQADRLKAFFKDMCIDKLYCSDLKRTVQTADTILQNRNLQLIKLSALREINMGVWEGRTFKEIKGKFPEEFSRRINEIETFKPDGGESFGGFRQRVLSEFNNIVNEKDENIVIVSHAGVIRLILASILDMPLKNIFILQQNYGCVNKIVFDGLRFKIVYLNNIP
jgi:probable phosphoglycerate mutase